MLGEDVEIPCPICENPIWLQLDEVVARIVVLCPVCRTQIQLQDDHGSTQNAIIEINQAMADLEKTMKGLFG